MKKIVFLLLILTSCTKEIKPIENEWGTIIVGKDVYYGYYLKALQINEDNTYRISFLNDDKVEVIISVQQQNITIETNKPRLIFYKGFNSNNQPNGRYIIYLEQNFKITKYFD